MGFEPGFPFMLYQNNSLRLTRSGSTAQHFSVVPMGVPKLSQIVPQHESTKATLESTKAYTWLMNIINYIM